MSYEVYFDINNPIVDIQIEGNYRQGRISSNETVP